MNRTTTPKSQSKQVKFWNFKARDGNSPAELILYGEISSGDTWYNDGATSSQFTKDIAALGDVSDITVRINSGGGDVFAAVAIFTQLKSHKARVTVIIDGWAASAATIIAMAGDVVKIPAAASFMIHDPSLGLLGYFDSDDLQTFVKELDVCKECIINAYMTKSSKTRDEIAELMSEETWYTGEQAVEQGFCDEVLFSDGDNSGKPIITDCATRYEHMPQALISGHPPVENTAQNKQEKESRKMEIKTTDELRAAYPHLVKEVETAAATAERTRIKAIEDSAIEGFENLANAAKFDKPESAADFAVSLVAKIKKQGADYLKDRAADVENSGMNGVGAEVTDGFAKQKDAIDEAIERRAASSKAGGKA